MIPGLVFGGLALIACALFLLWGLAACCIGCCRRCRGRRALAAESAGAAQFISSGRGPLPDAEVRGWRAILQVPWHMHALLAR